MAPRPEAGSQPRSTANSTISTSPTQKVGRLKPKIDPVISQRSSRDGAVAPASTPRGTPTSTASTIAVTASSSVAGSRSRITSMAFWW